MSYYDYTGPQPVVNPWFGNMPQPQMQQQAMQPQYAMNNCQCDNRFTYIQDKESARSYPLAPDKTMLFINDNESYAYIKKMDKDGKTSVFKTWKLVEEPESNPANNDIVTKEEFNNFQNSMQNTLDGILSKLDKLSNKQYNNNNQKRQVKEDG